MAEAEKQYFGSTDLLLLCQLIYREINKYVVKVEGKGLSQEDFTTELKNKLIGIDDTYAKLSGATFTGVVNVPTPTSESANSVAVNLGYLNSALSAVVGIKFDAGEDGKGYESLSDLQTKHPTGSAGTIYLVKNSGTGANKFDEYFWNEGSNSYERFGTSDADLTNYLRKTDVVEMSTADVQTVWDSVFGTSSGT